MEEKFFDDMMLAGQSWRNVENDYWVFWRAEEASDHFSIQDRIKTALSALNPSNSRKSRHLLIQFWAASTTMTEDGRRLLTTSSQPFAINCLTDEKLIQYKKDRSIYKFVAQGEDHNLTDGPISRVFRSQLPEMSPDLSYYSVKEYPERDLALRCGIKQTLVLPVFEPSRQCCVGVLELLFTKYIDFTFSRYILSVGRAFREAGLETPNPVHLDRQIPKIQLGLVGEELKEAMAQVRETHDLPLACLWARCEHISSVDPGGSLNRSYNDSGVNCWRELLVSIPGMRVSDRNASSSYFEYNAASSYLPLTVGQGPVSKVFHSDKPCFCADVAQLSIIHYPMAHIVRMLRFTGCFAVCLQSIATGNRVFVIEFFLPQDKRPSGDLHNLLSSILTILKQHLKSFEVLTGEASLVKGKNVISAEEGNTSFTYYNTSSTSSGHETTSSSSEFTSYHTISSLYIYSGYETMSISDEGETMMSMSISDEGES